MPEVLQYRDYRQFLMDFLSERKQKQNWYSVRYFAEKVGMDHGNLVRVLQGKRNLPEKNIAAALETMQLRGRRAEFFRLLVLYQRCKDPDKAADLLERLLSLSGQTKMQLEARQFEFYRTWYHNAVYHLVGCLDGHISPERISKMLTPPVNVTQVQKSLKLLQEIGLIERGMDGELVQTTNSLTTGKEWQSTIIHSYQSSMVEMARNSLQKHPRSYRDFSTLTMGLAEEDLGQIKEILKKARQEISKVVQESEPADSVYHLNLQMFPLAFVNKKQVRVGSEADPEVGSKGGSK